MRNEFKISAILCLHWARADNVLRHFKVYVQVLEKAETDTERFAALFLVPKLVKTGDCDKTARMHLVEAIGYSFLGKDNHL